MTDTVIKVENLSKQYRLGLVGTGTLRDDLSQVIAQLNYSKDEIKTIKKMKFYDNVLLKIFYLKGAMGWNRQYERLYGHPETILFDMEKFHYTLS